MPCTTVCFSLLIIEKNAQILRIFCAQIGKFLWATFCQTFSCPLPCRLQWAKNVGKGERRVSDSGTVMPAYSSFKLLVRGAALANQDYVPEVKYGGGAQQPGQLPISPWYYESHARRPTLAIVARRRRLPRGLRMNPIVPRGWWDFGKTA